jgi:IS30 family transposase
MFIQLRLQDGFTPYKIAKQLGRARNTILNEMRRGTTTQIYAKKKVDVYLASTGKAVYDNNRKNSCKPFKRLQCSDFIDYVTKMIKEDKWSPDACVGRALKSGKFKPSEMVCTKTLYNYIDLGLMRVKNSDLTLKLQYNTKSKRTRKNMRKLGNSIELRPKSVDQRNEFGHWEIDTVIGKKSRGEEVLLTIVERQTRNAIIRRIPSKTADAVSNEFQKIRSFFGDRFSKVFKTITSDNGSEFSELHELESKTSTKV